MLFWVADTLMGGSVRLAPGAPATYRALVWAESAVEKVEIIRDGQVLAEARPPDRYALIEGTDPMPRGGAGYYYLRVTQFDEEQAWSSPVFYVADAKHVE